MLQEFSDYYYKDYDYFSIDIGCGPSTTDLLDKGAAVWIKKVGGADYSVRVLTNPDDFFKFKIPQALIEKISPLMKETASYSFVNNMKGVKKNDSR